MRDKGQIEKDPNSLFPSTIKLSKLITEEIIKTGGIETAGVDSVQAHEHIRITEIELLV